MSKLLKRTQIDIEKYNYCINNSLQKTVYAFSWYLDIVADDWQLLVLDDYRVVMPIPYIKTRRNLYRNKILQPLFCQQLGVFSIAKIAEKDFKHFIKMFFKLQPKRYQFNISNTSILAILENNFLPKINYELNLNKIYTEIYQNYAKNLQRNLVKAQKKEIEIKEIHFSKIILMKKETSKIMLKSKNYIQLEKLFTVLLKQKKGISLGVFTENKLIATAFFIKMDDRIIHLISSSNETGKRVGAISFLFDTLIKKYATKNIIFDFEGSVIPGVARFFKGFGAAPKTYLSL